MDTTLCPKISIASLGNPLGNYLQVKCKLSQEGDYRVKTECHYKDGIIQKSWVISQFSIELK